jgi:hypothetical protein
MDGGLAGVFPRSLIIMIDRPEAILPAAAGSAESILQARVRH